MHGVSSTGSICLVYTAHVRVLCIQQTNGVACGAGNSTCHWHHRQQHNSTCHWHHMPVLVPCAAGNTTCPCWGRQHGACPSVCVCVCDSVFTLNSQATSFTFLKPPLVCVCVCVCVCVPHCPSFYACAHVCIYRNLLYAYFVCVIYVMCTCHRYTCTYTSYLYISMSICMHVFSVCDVSIVYA